MKHIEVFCSVGFCALSFLATASALSGCQPDPCADAPDCECPEIPEIVDGTYQVVSEEPPTWASSIGDVIIVGERLKIQYTDESGTEYVAVWSLEVY